VYVARRNHSAGAHKSDEFFLAREIESICHAGIMDGPQEVAGQNQAERTVYLLIKRSGIKCLPHRGPASNALIALLTLMTKGHDKEAGAAYGTGGLTTTLI
jgi:hypothetical protein